MILSNSTISHLTECDFYEERARSLDVYLIQQIMQIFNLRCDPQTINTLRRYHGVPYRELYNITNLNMDPFIILRDTSL